MWQKHRLIIRIAAGVLPVIVTLWAMKTDEVLTGVLGIILFVVWAQITIEQLYSSKGEEYTENTFQDSSRGEI